MYAGNFIMSENEVKARSLETYKEKTLGTFRYWNLWFMTQGTAQSQRSHVKIYH